MTDARLERAKKRVEDLKGYYIHITMYLFVNLGLFLIDAIQGNGWWFYWVSIGWGIGVLGHSLAMLFDNTRRAADWEQRKIDQYIEQLPHETIDEPRHSSHLIG